MSVRDAIQASLEDRENTTMSPREPLDPRCVGDRWYNPVPDHRYVWDGKVWCNIEEYYNSRDLAKVRKMQYLDNSLPCPVSPAAMSYKALLRRLPYADMRMPEADRIRCNRWRYDWLHECYLHMKTEHERKWAWTTLLDIKEKDATRTNKPR